MRLALVIVHRYAKKLWSLLGKAAESMAAILGIALSPNVDICHQAAVWAFGMSPHSQPARSQGGALKYLHVHMSLLASGGLLRRPAAWQHYWVSLIG